MCSCSLIILYSFLDNHLCCLQDAKKQKEGENDEEEDEDADAEEEEDEDPSDDDYAQVCTENLDLICSLGLEIQLMQVMIYDGTLLFQMRYYD